MTILLESIDIVKITLPCKFQVIKIFSLGQIRVTKSKPMGQRVNACDLVATLDDIPPNQGNNLNLWQMTTQMRMFAAEVASASLLLTPLCCKEMYYPLPLCIGQIYLVMILNTQLEVIGGSIPPEEFMVTWIPGKLKGKSPGILSLCKYNF